MITETINLLGHKATDRVTGFSGVITSVCFDLYGCVQASITPPAKEDAEEIKFGHWFDVNRLEVAEETVMPVPDFEAKATTIADFKQGPAEKRVLGDRY